VLEISVAVWPPEVAETSLKPTNLRRQYPENQGDRAVTTTKHE